MVLSAQNKKFFEQFGYLHFPGLFKPDLEWIVNEFEAVFAARKDVVHTGEKRTMFPGAFVCQSAKLCALLDDPRMQGICEGTMGPDYQYAGGDGNFYSGDTGWHSDLMPGVGMYRHNLHVKIAFYLDPLTRDTGALRVIPGSHIPGDRFTDNMDEMLYKHKLDGRDVPSVALETQPGDLVLFTHNLKHASFGGSKRRRMFVLNLQAYPHTEGAKAEYRGEWLHYASQGCTEMHSKIMMDTASPERLKHLQPIIELFKSVLAEHREKQKQAALQPA